MSLMDAPSGSVKDRAGETFETYGVPVIPVAADKIPLVPWRHWQTESMTREQFDALPWSEAANYAIILGTKTKKGFFFCAVDCDKPIDYSLLPTTMTESTPRGGRHFYYLSELNCDGLKLHDVGVELLGLGQIVVVYHRFLNDNLPTMVYSVQAVFADLARGLGKKDMLTRGRQPLQQVLKPQTEGNRNRAIFDLSAALRDQNVPFATALRTAIATNQTYEPPLTEAEVRSTVQSAYEHPLKETSRDAIDAWFYYDEQGHRKFAPVVFAKHLMSQYRFKTAKDNKTMYVYSDKAGIYLPEGVSVIQSEMTSLLDDATRKGYYGDVEFYIQGITFFDRPQVPSNKIACLNGILNFDSNPIHLEPFTPDEFILVQIPVNYMPGIDCPKIKQFTIDIVGQDQTSIVQQTIGYCLCQSHLIHKATMLVGDGANGKSTLIELVKRFLGPANVSNVSLQSLCENRFAVAQLYGKLANLNADLPDKGLMRTGMFKMVTGGDTVPGEEKFKAIFSFKPHAKHIYSANKVPETTDDTIAFFRRWNIIMCQNRFVGASCDPLVLDKICTPEEFSGLLNWALEGLKTLLDKGEFANNPSTEAIREQYIRQSNSAKAFIEEQLEPSGEPSDWIDETTLYSQYAAYCQENKLPSKPKRNFTMEMKQHMPHAKQTKQRVEHGEIHVWQYILPNGWKYDKPTSKDTALH